MAIDSDIRDQAYQFFIQEAPELLQVIETDLLALREERSTAKIHNMMRAAHSIKGGAASVGLEIIKTLAHSLEDIFKGLHNPELEIDADVENLLLQAYDCLRLPLIEQLNTGQFDAEQAMADAEPVFAQIEAQIGEYLKGSNDIPSSVELGVDIAASIFEVDVAQGIDRLTQVLAQSQDKETIEGEVRAQAEVFAGLAELLNLPGFGAIASTTLAALDAHPNAAIAIAQTALADFQAARLAVLAGERTQGGTPSDALTSLVNQAAPATLEISTLKQSQQQLPLEQISDGSPTEAVTLSLDDLFSDGNNVEPLLDLEPAGVLTSINQLAGEVVALEAVSLDDVFGSFGAESTPDTNLAAVFTPESTVPQPAVELATSSQENITELVQSVEQIFATTNSSTSSKPDVTTNSSPTTQLSVRVDLDRLERMNNLIGELAINRNSLSLQNEQLQATIQELLRRFTNFQSMARQLRDLSDLMVVAPEHHARGRSSIDPGILPIKSQGLGMQRVNSVSSIAATSTLLPSLASFDSLEMDSYSEVYSLLQATLEDVVQLEETVGDVVLLAGQSSDTIERQRQMLAHLRDDLMWARMLPLGEVLNRFPRMLRDLSRSYDKAVDLKLSGTGVLVDKAVLEKLYDPLLHLVRNAFDHGIEPSNVRLEQGKLAQGKIEIRAYHQGNQTIIEVRDDGRGLNLERIRAKASETGLLSPEQVTTASTARLLDLIFEPGFSTAKQVSELSGRGVGLDIVRAQLRSLKGNVTVSSEPGKGSIFSLRIPLTLTIAKLLVCFVGTNAYALPSDSIAEILIPEVNQVKYSGGYRFLHWQDHIIPIYRLSEVIRYSCPLPETVPNLNLEVFPTPEDWASPMLLLEQENNIVAVEVDRLVTEQELVIKPFGKAIAPPNYIYGCTILGNGSLIPVIDGAQMLASFAGSQTNTTHTELPSDSPVISSSDSTPTIVKRDSTLTVLVVDDSITLRQTLVLTLQKAGYRVLQARDGREAIEQLQQSVIQLVVCDVEMPNMNGFEFLSHRRQDPQMSKIPVVMLTSRSSDKHRQLAKHLGATNYFTKPYIEQEFVAAIKDTIQQNSSMIATV
ncbi:hybrid sensor histidine kinase/response regulator [Gloeocapsopsis dulcis]|uniref:histidine kinase n=1 Tax=Gloeocapsopsis dulcis AAB1 = 1H9 TaxID=1433147 RepID=A0A6N8FRS4_9CHRO|nr:hybrid sensor histidine kinase/response regulator [Gloeocapsopsis dulcis]MUL35830.1 hybrid sensor histidine kinase/response regulator [Gloeocapsopsis dulcis AAB1 = 1H9]WNN87704.1 hybrid sensor histidine kinase/response regulator [Gloeocapsopsis dulcis]